MAFHKILRFINFAVAKLFIEENLFSTSEEVQVVCIDENSSFSIGNSKMFRTKPTINQQREKNLIRL